MRRRSARPVVFTPGRGALPPYLAGREDEQRVLAEMHELLCSGGRVPADVVLIGPRGNGKTALLHWFRRTIAERGVADVVWLTPAEIPSGQDLARMLSTGERASEVRFTAGVGPLAGEWTLGGRPHLSLADLLIARCRRKPLVVLLDEAHRLNPAVGEVLLNASQKAGNHAPFLLCLAGTPALETHLRQTNATFAERSRELRIRLLDRNAAAAALTEPLQAGGIGTEPDALEAVLDASLGYPYFIQVWGSALYRALASDPGGDPVVTLDTVRAARAEFEGVCDRYYGGRYNELRGAGLLAEADAIARAFARCGVGALDFAGLEQAMVDAGASAAALSTLQEMGYVWVSYHPEHRRKYGTANLLEPGIPSLVGYVLEQRAIEAGVARG